MNNATTLLQGHDLLRETAARLIESVGVDMAIYICRSNYWHGMLNLILDPESRLTAPAKTVEPDQPNRLHSLPGTMVKPARVYEDFEEIALAA